MNNQFANQFVNQFHRDDEAYVEAVRVASMIVVLHEQIGIDKVHLLLSSISDLIDAEPAEFDDDIKKLLEFSIKTVGHIQ